MSCESGKAERRLLFADVLPRFFLCVPLELAGSQPKPDWKLINTAAAEFPIGGSKAVVPFFVRAPLIRVLNLQSVSP